MNEFLRASIEVVLGIALLFGGGELFVQAAVTLALVLGIPQLVIGLTVVSLGTSAPELFVSINSVMQGSDALAVSNVVGSNIFNILVVLGSSALVIPLKVENRLVMRDVPLMMAVSAAVWGMASAGRVTWQAGSALLLGLLINIVWEIRSSKKQTEVYSEAEAEEAESEGGWPIAIIKLLVGITMLTFGSRIMVSGASTTATLLGVSEAVIGLTIVSAGTSLPELITSLVAALRGSSDLAIGNVIGSCLLNLMLVLGSGAIATSGDGLQVSTELITDDIPVMLLTSFICLPIFWTEWKINRLEGGLLLSLYGFYILDNVLPRTNLSSLSDEFRLVMLCLVMPVTMIIIIARTAHYWKSRLRRTVHHWKSGSQNSP